MLHHHIRSHTAAERRQLPSATLQRDSGSRLLSQPEQSAPERGIFGFSYTVTITNTGGLAAQLVSRHWVICDSAGRSEEVKGLGVLGHQPLIKPGESFQYTSGSRLATASGTMHGSYFCVAEDGERFEAVIPMFVLEAHSAEGTPGTTTRVLH